MGGRSGPVQGSSSPPKEAQLPFSTGWFELHQALFNALPKGVVELGRSFSGFEERADGVLSCSCVGALKSRPWTPQLNRLGSVQYCVMFPTVLAGSMAWLVCMAWQAQKSAYKLAQHSRPAAWAEP